MRDSIVGMRVAQMRNAMDQAEKLRLQADAFYKQAADDKQVRPATPPAVTFEAINTRKGGFGPEVQSDAKQSLAGPTRVARPNPVLSSATARSCSGRLDSRMIAWSTCSSPPAFAAAPFTILIHADLPTAMFESFVDPNSDKARPEVQVRRQQVRPGV